MHLRSITAYRSGSRKGAIELSISTVVIIVLGIFMLILGIVLVRQIFSFTTDSVDTISEKTKQELNNLFGEQEGDVIVRLGPQNTAKVKPGTDSFGIALASRTPDGSAILDRNRLTYTLTLDKANGKNCIDQSYLGEKRTESLFDTPINSHRLFDQYDGANAYSIIRLKVPKGTPLCSQKVFIDAKDTKTNQPVGGTFFIVEIIKGGLF